MSRLGSRKNADDPASTTANCVRVPYSAIQKTGSSTSAPTPDADPPDASRRANIAPRKTIDGPTRAADGSRRQGSHTVDTTTATVSAIARTNSAGATSWVAATSTNPSRVAST